LSLMLSEAVRLPLAAGVKVTLMVQFPPAATKLPQLLVWAKSLAFGPVIARPVIVKSPLPVLLRAMVRAALVVPTGWLAKVRLVSERLTAGGVGVAGEEGLGAEPAPVPGIGGLGAEPAPVPGIGGLGAEPAPVPGIGGLGAEPVAIPDKLILWGLPMALSVMLTEADR